MALIKCPECGKEISNQAKQCIFCGFPLQQEEINEQFDESKVIYEFYLIASLPSIRVPLLRMASAKRTIFTLFVDDKLIKADIRPFDLIHFKLTKDVFIKITSNEFRKESTARICNNDQYFIKNDLLPRVFLIRYFNTGWTASLFDGYTPVTDGYQYKQGLFSAKRIGKLTKEEQDRIINSYTMWCKAYGGRPPETIEVSI